MDPLKERIFDKLTYVTKRMGEAEDNESLAGFSIAWRLLRDILTEENLDKEYMEYIMRRRKKDGRKNGKIYCRPHNEE